MVVGDDGVNASRFEILHFLDCRYARINGDNELRRMIRKDFFQCVDAYSVAVFVAVGNEVKHVEFVAQIQHKRGYRANAVAVVVAVNKHFFFVFDCFSNTRDSLLHTVDFIRRREFVQRRMKIVVERIFAHTSSQQQTQKVLGNPKTLCKRNSVACEWKTRSFYDVSHKIIKLRPQLCEGAI